MLHAKFLEDQGILVVPKEEAPPVAMTVAEMLLLDDEATVDGTLTINLLDIFLLELNSHDHNKPFEHILKSIVFDEELQTFPLGTKEVSITHEQLQKDIDTLANAPELHKVITTLSDFLCPPKSINHFELEEYIIQKSNGIYKVMQEFNSFVNQHERIEKALTLNKNFSLETTSAPNSRVTKVLIPTMMSVVGNFQANYNAEEEGLNTTLQAYKNTLFDDFTGSIPKAFKLVDPWATFQEFMNNESPASFTFQVEVTGVIKRSVVFFLLRLFELLETARFSPSQVGATLKTIRNIAQVNINNRWFQNYLTNLKLEAIQDPSSTTMVHELSFFFLFYKKIIMFLKHRLSSILTTTEENPFPSLTTLLAEWMLIHPSTHNFEETSQLIYTQINHLNENHDILNRVCLIHYSYLKDITLLVLKLQKAYAMARDRATQPIPSINEYVEGNTDKLQLFCPSWFTSHMAGFNQSRKFKNNPFNIYTSKRDASLFHLLHMEANSMDPFMFFENRLVLRNKTEVVKAYMRSIQAQNPSLTAICTNQQCSVHLNFVGTALLFATQDVLEAHKVHETRMRTTKKITANMRKKYNLHDKIYKHLIHDGYDPILQELNKDVSNNYYSNNHDPLPKVDFVMGSSLRNVSVEIKTTFYDLHTKVALKFKDNPELRAYLVDTFPRYIGVFEVKDGFKFHTPFFMAYNEFYVPTVLLPKSRKTREHILDLVDHEPNNYLSGTGFVTEIVKNIHQQRSQVEMTDLLRIRKNDLYYKLSKRVDCEVNIQEYLDKNKETQYSLINEQDIFVEFMLAKENSNNNYAQL